MSSFTEALEMDLAALVIRHSTISGAEFQQCALRVAAGYYSEDDLDSYHRPDDLAQALAKELERLALAD